MFHGGNVIAEYDHDNFLLRKYIYGPRVDEPVCMIDAVADDAEYYYHFDGLGSVVALSDSAGDTVQTYEYSIYGQVAASDPNFLTNPYLFTGRRFDLETGLYYYRARYYNPHIGRFMQTDPVGYGAGINWYAYCGNNPLAYADPSGLLRYRDPNDPNDILTGAIYDTSTGNWWGFVGEWTIDDIRAWYWCEPEEVLSHDVAGITVYVELDLGLPTLNPPEKRADGGEIVYLEELEKVAIILAIEEEISTPIEIDPDTQLGQLRQNEGWPWTKETEPDYLGVLDWAIRTGIGLYIPGDPFTSWQDCGYGDDNSWNRIRELQEADQNYYLWRTFWKWHSSNEYPY